MFTFGQIYYLLKQSKQLKQKHIVNLFCKVMFSEVLPNLCFLSICKAMLIAYKSYVYC